MNGVGTFWRALPHRSNDLEDRYKDSSFIKMRVQENSDLGWKTQKKFFCCNLLSSYSLPKKYKKFWHVTIGCHSNRGFWQHPSQDNLAVFKSLKVDFFTFLKQNINIIAIFWPKWLHKIWALSVYIIMFKKASCLMKLLLCYCYNYKLQYAKLQYTHHILVKNAVLVWIAINMAAILCSWYLLVYCSTTTQSNMEDHEAVLTITLNSRLMSQTNLFLHHWYIM